MGHPRIEAELADLFRAAGRDAEIIALRDGQNPADAARAASARASIVVAAGGDGTVSSVAAGIFESPAALGVLPLGTLNHFAKDLHIPLDLRKAVAVVAAGHIGHVDVGQVNDRIFVNNSSIGIYPSIVEAREELRRQGHSKWPAMAIATLRVLRRYRGVTVSIDVDGQRRTWRTPFVFVGNNEYAIDGIRLGARARLDEGQLFVYPRAARPRAPSPGAPGESAARPRQAIWRLRDRARHRAVDGTSNAGAARRPRRRGDDDDAAAALSIAREGAAGRARPGPERRCGPSSICPTCISAGSIRGSSRRSSQAIRAIAPDLVAVSGDLTQRAPPRQFQQARAFLEQLPFPLLVVPGNHDVPLYNIAARFLNPYGGYRRYIARSRAGLRRRRELIVVGLNSARPSRSGGGRLNAAQVARAAARLRSAPPDAVRIVVTHHPFDLPEGHGDEHLIGRSDMAMQQLAAAGADLFLAGHLHVSHVGRSAERYQIAGHSALVVQAGTLSTRGRGELNTFNVLRRAPAHHDRAPQLGRGARRRSRRRGAARFSTRVPPGVRLAPVSHAPTSDSSVTRSRSGRRRWPCCRCRCGRRSPGPGRRRRRRAAVRPPKHSPAPAGLWTPLLDALNGAPAVVVRSARAVHAADEQLRERRTTRPPREVIPGPDRRIGRTSASR